MYNEKRKPMSISATGDAGDIKRPTAWKHVVGAVIAFPFCSVVADFGFPGTAPRTGECNHGDDNGQAALVRCAAGGGHSVCSVLNGVTHHRPPTRASARGSRKTSNSRSRKPAVPSKARREYVLEVMGLGVT